MKISIDFFQSGQRKNIEIYTEEGGGLSKRRREKMIIFML